MCIRDRPPAVPDAIDVVLMPPVGYLAMLVSALEHQGLNAAVSAGAQNLHADASGAFTGETSGDMLVDLGARYVLVGHSELRALFGESNEVVAAKFQAALRSGLSPVLCVGETLAERQAGKEIDVVRGQVSAVIDRVGAAGLASGVVAYEPVWAIGTGQTASPEQAQDMHLAIRELLAATDRTMAESVRIVYGGSVKPDNAAALFAKPDIDGGLVGGASLEATDFAAIIAAAGTE